MTFQYCLVYNALLTFFASLNNNPPSLVGCQILGYFTKSASSITFLSQKEVYCQTIDPVEMLFFELEDKHLIDGLCLEARGLL